MRLRPCLTYLAFILPLLTSGKVITYSEHTPITVFSTEEDFPVWDLSAVSALDSPVRVSARLYGDSIYAETIGDFRSLYALRGDRAEFISDESIMIALTPERSITPFSPVRGGAVSDTLFLTGTRGPVSIAILGLMNQSSSRLGELIIDEEKRFPGVRIWSEIREFEQTLDVSDTHDVQNLRTTRHRWVSSGSPLPIALQYEIDTLKSSGGWQSVYKGLFLPDRDILDPDTFVSTDDNSVIQSMLDKTVVQLVDGEIRITNPESFCQPLIIDVTDVQGNLYIHRDADCRNGAVLTISASALPAGNYIVAVHVEGYQASFKQLISRI